jgi:hypothetical protein
MKRERKNDVESYIAQRKGRDSKFAEGFEVFRLGAMLAAAREQARISQEELAQASRDQAQQCLPLGTETNKHDAGYSSKNRCRFGEDPPLYLSKRLHNFTPNSIWS